MRAALIACLVALPTTALAQPSLTEPTPEPFEYRTKPTPPEYKNPTTATTLALGASAVGIGTIFLGSQMHGGDTPIMMIGGLITVFGPSSGHWWAGQSAKLTPGLGIRLIGASIAGLGFARAIDTKCKTSECDVPLENGQSNTLIGIGVATVVVGMVWDIATAGRAAQRANDRYGFGPQPITTARGTTAGVGVTGRF